MSRRHVGPAVTLLLVGLNSINCHAQPQQSPAPPNTPSIEACDCSKRVGTCRATVTFKEGSLNVTSSSRQCSLVTFQVNDDSRTSTVVNGKAVEQWFGGEITNLEVMSCGICADTRK